ncbi:RecF/RecN/SMC protein [Onchocerca flexuosa]|uniref:Structural maintenance of chromosomes protein n=3 Tax=Onchocerca flexuosa TaxID=387005 RepID=A0A238C133_9BILA|nr:RecF/RecN/SMC protein [Onchocerca flexuosa]
MRIKRIEIDGFKSYAQRQVIDGFDAQFNAITGLNGSGKSNILDAICFVLGISNLSQVRAAQLSDLVYKQGQAGISKATVTITFDNTDISNRPVGFDKYDEIVVRRQIVINGRNTYTINGAAATNSRVADMFRTVGLNVNNPHFLIMQGRITKVLNMKPMEIVGMIEEAAGTRMYEAKKQSAVRTIEKKEGKMAEIKQLMEEDILPQVEKLKRDRSNFLEYQKIGRELEALQRKLIAFDYMSSLTHSHTLQDDIASVKNQIREIDKIIYDTKEELDRKELRLKELEDNKNTKTGREKKEIEDRIKDTMAALTAAEADRDAMRDKGKETKTTISRKTKSIQSDKNELEKKCRDLKKLETEIGDEEKRGKEAEEAVKRARNKMEALAKGMITDEDGQAVTLDAQLTAQRSALSTLETKIKTAQMRLKQLEPLLAKKKNELDAITSQADSEERERLNLEQQVRSIETKLNGLNFNEEVELQIANERRTLAAERSALADVVMDFEARNPYLKFDYSDPYPNFDRRLVNGIVAKLFRIRDFRFATALEVAGGGALYNIVVRNAQIGRDLLKNGNLRHRVTILPLDKIEGRVLDNRKLQRAQNLVGKENVFIAKDLIDYAPELEPAMRHVFGNVFICTSDNDAKKVTFDAQINARSVSLAGSDFNPGGVLTGGSRGNKTALLTSLDTAMKNIERISEIDCHLHQLEDQLKEMAPIRQQYIELSGKHGQCSRRLQAMKDKNGCIERKKLEEKIDVLNERKKNEKMFQEKEKKEAQKDLGAAEKELASLKNNFEKARISLETLREEIASLKKTIAEDEEELSVFLKETKQSAEEMTVLEENVSKAKEAADEAKKEMQKFTEKMRERDAYMRSVVETMNALKKSLKESDLKKEQLQKDIQDMKKNIEDCTRRATRLEKQHSWIMEEKHHFGQTGTAYDFTDYSIEKGQKELEDRTARKHALERSINAKAMNMLGTAEEQCRQLEIKMEQLMNDKAKLLDAIKKLDIKKKNEIIKAHEKVNRDFGNIFSTLLPGTNAKLEPPAGATSALGGLEVKVAFRNKWKDSLGELSGGQRSLVALSLVLAMLKFKPAPIYILDEVDAALDLSHTQNIGSMIKTHFKESQFIIVSLKDGMFNHANVLFKTRFVDGTSAVVRTENKDQWVIDEPIQIRDIEKENDSDIPRKRRKE